jgi:hypothetical protein
MRFPPRLRELLVPPPTDDIEDSTILEPLPAVFVIMPSLPSGRIGVLSAILIESPDTKPSARPQVEICAAPSAHWVPSAAISPRLTTFVVPVPIACPRLSTLPALSILDRCTVVPREAVRLVVWFSPVLSPSVIVSVYVIPLL